MLADFLQEFREGKRQGSVISCQTLDSISMDEKETWRTIRKELEDIGMTVAAFDANKAFIFEWFTQAVANGAFEEQTIDERSTTGTCEISSHEQDRGEERAREHEHEPEENQDQNHEREMGHEEAYEKVKEQWEEKPGRSTTRLGESYFALGPAGATVGHLPSSLFRLQRCLTLLSRRRRLKMKGVRPLLPLQRNSRRRRRELAR